ncbi:MAG TPA: fumarylacetoacetate hydrolase family protein [Gaiellaceae bacterium]|nr:fumarylacetoacetate hydrolase family protein [Gaiellaceae bacterium]
MRVVSFVGPDGSRLGVVEGDLVVDLSRVEPAAPRDLREVLRAGRLPELQRLALGAAPGARRPLDELQLELPVPSPGRIFCLGLNYRDHIAEGPFEDQEYPAFFMRGATSLIAHGEPIIRPEVSVALDYEAELAVIIGKRARHLREVDCADVIAGYTCFNDGSVRDYQQHTIQWTIGKNFDGTGAFGPAMVTPDELPPFATGLRIQCRLNGEVVQDSSTDRMIFSVPEVLVYLTSAATLYPGDVVVMGTPAGVGMSRNPQLWMKHGDVVEVEIESVGTLVNGVKDELAPRETGELHETFADR